jgi:uncharacterized protein (UPF0264 family)
MGCLCRMKLLVSVVDEEEALEAVQGGADVIDVKNPKEGSLGASFPWTIKLIKKASPPTVKVSCTLGDSPNLPGTMSLAALGAASTGADYVKVGLFQVRTLNEAVYLMQNVVKAAKNCDAAIKVVVTGYADAARVGAVSPLLVPKIAHKAGADVAMVDTAVKDDKTMFAFLSDEQLKRFVRETHDFGLLAGFAGALKKEDLAKSHTLGADIVGFRGGVCSFGDRVNGRVDRQKVRELVEISRRLEAQLELRV